MSGASRSLQRDLILRSLAVQAGVVLLAVTVLFCTGHLFNFTSEEATVEILAEAVDTDAGGRLVLRPTQAMQELRASVPDLWFVLRDRAGRSLSEGHVPAEYAGIGGALDRIGQARMGWRIGDPDRPTARLRWVDTDAGEVQVLTGSAGKLSIQLVLLSISLVFATVVLPILVVMTLASLVATPLVVRRALRSVQRAATEAQRIDVDQRGVRLPTGNVPAEILPLVQAVNAALQRLDEGYEQNRRFLADAAHELRTPIAILNIRVAALPAGSSKNRLLADVARLGLLTEQLLDLQRLDQDRTAFSPVDLVELARAALIDLAPLAFAAGYHVSFEPKAKVIEVAGDRLALERALTNLVQNAIEHGGGSGTITVRVQAPGWIEVCDDGEGIPPEERERIFAPFYRLRPKSRGAGLGLNLVREIMRLHGGSVVAVDSAGRGACFRMTF